MSFCFTLSPPKNIYLFFAKLINDSQVGDEDETQNEKGEQEEEERERAWDTAVMLCVEGMREPDRREWFRDQRMQEEHEARNAQTVDSWCDLSVTGYIE
jgi:hypothetical protein